jgi:hypothetical protein
VIGALLDRAAATISFFKNGVDLGVAFRHVSEQRLFPTVGLRTQQEEVRANFGAGGSAGFAVDLPAMRAAFARAALDGARAVRLPASAAACGSGSGGGGGGAAGGALGAAAAGWPLLPALVFEYLIHHRCWRTAEALAKDVVGGAGSSSEAAGALGGVSAARGGDNEDTTMQREGSLSSMDVAGASSAAPTTSGGPGAGATAAAAAAARASEVAGGGDGGDTDMAPAPPLEPAAQAAHGVVAAGEPGAAAASAAAAGGAAAAGAALPSAEVEDAVRRQQIYDAVCAGRLEEALQQVGWYCFPGSVCSILFSGFEDVSSGCACERVCGPAVSPGRQCRRTPFHRCGSTSAGMYQHHQHQKEVQHHLRTTSQPPFTAPRP